jgi:hypothetical protein
VKRLLYAAAGLAACAALSLGATAASAAGKPLPIRNATNACSGACVDVHFVVPGHDYILKDHSGLTSANNPIALTLGSNGLASEDFTPIDVGTIATEYCNGPVPFSGSVFTARQCQLLDNAGLDTDTVYQLAYDPDNGGPSAMCAGAWDNISPVPSGYKVRLETCGIAADTVMILADQLPSGSVSGGSTPDGPEWVINGGSDNFSNPVVATNNGGTAWQDPRWETVNVNGGHAQDTQEIKVDAGPFK